MTDLSNPCLSKWHCASALAASVYAALPTSASCDMLCLAAAGAGERKLKDHHACKSAACQHGFMQQQGIGFETRVMLGVHAQSRTM